MLLMVVLNFANIGIVVNVTDGTFEYDRKNQYVSYTHETVSGRHTVEIVAKR